jgi:glutathione S-transferase
VTDHPPRDRYVVVVARDQPDLLRYLRLRCARDPSISVVPGETGGEFVVVERRPSPSSGKDLISMGESETIEDRQRLERWLDEGQYMLGRIVPSLVEERDRLKARAEAAEDECGRLRHEILELRKVINDLNGEGQYLRQEQAAIAESVGALMGQLAELQRPLHDVHRRIQSVGARPVGEPAV